MIKKRKGKKKERNETTWKGKQRTQKKQNDKK